MNEKTLTVWITKYALTQGIFVAEAKQVSERMVQVIGPKWAWTPYFHGKDWHVSEQDARADFDRRKAAKLRSLQKQVDRIHSLTPNFIIDSPEPSV